MTYFPPKFGKVSVVNSSVLALLSTENFTGTFENVSEYNNVSITAIIGLTEKVTLTVDFSTDGSGTNKTTQNIVIDGSDNNDNQLFPVITSFFRITITADQGTAANGYIQVIYNKSIKIQTVQAGDTVLDNSDSIVTKSINTGVDVSGVYQTTGVDTLNATILNTTNALNSRAVITGRALDGTTYNTVGVDLISTTTLAGTLSLNTRAIVTGVALDGTTYNNVGMNVANASILDSTMSMNTRSIITGRSFNSNVYSTVSINTANTAVDNTTMSMNTRSIVTGRAIDDTTYNTVGVNAANAIVLDSTQSLNTRSITTGKDTAGVYQTTGVDALNAVILNTTNAVDTRAVITGRALDGTTYNTVGVNVANATVIDSTQSLNTRAVITGKDTNGIYRTNVVQNVMGVNSLASYITGPLDTFNRIQTSSPVTIFSWDVLTNNFTTSANFIKYNTSWDTLVVGANSVLSFTNSLPQVTLTLNGSSVTNDKIVRQQHGYNVYLIGKGMIINCSGTLLTVPTVSNVVSRIGYYDDINDKSSTYETNINGNGFFFQMVGGTQIVSVVYRTSNIASFTQTDYPIVQASWNIDTLNGSGVSGITVDFTKRLAFFITMNWPTGNVVMGVYYNNLILPCHQFKFSNGQYSVTEAISSFAYISRASLPVRYELIATGTPSGTATLIQLSSSVICEGGYSPLLKFYSMTNFTLNTANTGGLAPFIPMTSLRLNTSSGVLRPRTKLTISSAFVYVENLANIRFFLFKNPFAYGTGVYLAGTAPVWQNYVNNAFMGNSSTEYDTTATQIDISSTTYPCELVYTYIADAIKSTFILDFSKNIVISSDYLGRSDILVVCVDKIGGGAAPKANVTFNWSETE